LSEPSVTIESVEDGEAFVEEHSLIVQSFVKKPLRVRMVQMPVPFRTKTLEGYLDAPAGSWLVLGEHSDPYPIADHVKQKTYNPVSDKPITITVHNRTVLAEADLEQIFARVSRIVKEKVNV
jgi:hypothetical protein